MKITILTIISIFLIVISYYTFVIIEANSYTNKVIKIDLKNKKWKIKGKETNKLEIGISDFSEYQLKSLIAVQDPKFYDHNGLDLTTPGAGLTTITQAIVKKLYFENFKPGIAKIKQSLIAIFIVDSKLTKKEQLELFVNLSYFGSVNKKPIYGFNRAAFIYYKKPFKELLKDEYLSLVAMLIAPKTFSILREPTNNIERLERIKKLLSGQYMPKYLTGTYYDIGI